MVDSAQERLGLLVRFSEAVSARMLRQRLIARHGCDLARGQAQLQERAPNSADTDTAAAAAAAAAAAEEQAVCARRITSLGRCVRLWPALYLTPDTVHVLVQPLQVATLPPAVHGVDPSARAAEAASAVGGVAGWQGGGRPGGGGAARASPAAGTLKEVGSALKAWGYILEPARGGLAAAGREGQEALAAGMVRVLPCVLALASGRAHQPASPAAAHVDQHPRGSGLGGRGRGLAWSDGSGEWTEEELEVVARAVHILTLLMHWRVAGVSECRGAWQSMVCDGALLAHAACRASISVLSQRLCQALALLPDACAGGGGGLGEDVCQVRQFQGMAMLLASEVPAARAPAPGCTPRVPARTRLECVGEHA